MSIYDELLNVRHKNLLNTYETISAFMNGKDFEMFRNDGICILIRRYVFESLFDNLSALSIIDYFYCCITDYKSIVFLCLNGNERSSYKKIYTYSEEYENIINNYEKCSIKKLCILSCGDRNLKKSTEITTFNDYLPSRC